MSYTVVSNEQTIEVKNVEQSILVDSGTQHIFVNPATQRVSIVNAGPIGPKGATGEPGAVVGGVSEQTLNDAIDLHASDPIPHINATSGRDFSALFQNGLI